MSSITVHIIDGDGLFLFSRSGDVDSVMLAVDIEKTDFTMKPPPDRDNRWKWVDNDWVLLANPPVPTIADETAE